MAKSELFDIKVLGKMIRMNAFPVKRGEPDRAALKHAIKLLQMGEPVCIFPEGQLSETGELQELKPGVALIARSAGVPVICVGLKNTNKMLPYGTLLPRPGFTWMEATWGEPRTFDKSTETEEFLTWVSGQLRELTA
jgi:1-acyl-sn-glycerol-3-phosphate acyltransferase